MRKLVKTAYVTALLLFASATGVYAAGVEWVKPSPTGAIDCSDHRRCFSVQRSFRIAVDTISPANSIDFEANTGDGWSAITSRTIPGNGEYQFKINLDTINGQKYRQTGIQLRAIAKTTGGSVTSDALELKLDSIPPAVEISKPNDTIINFTNNLNSLQQHISINDPDANGITGSGIQLVRYFIFNSVSGEFYSDFTGIQSSTNTLSTGTNSIATTLGLNWGKKIYPGYYWVKYEALDNSVASEDVNGDASSFNAGAGFCSLDNGSKCQHIDGTTAPESFYPVVLDPTPPVFTQVEIDGQDPEQTSVDAINLAELTFQYMDDYSWLRNVTLEINDQDVPINFNNRSKSGNYNNTFNESLLVDGNNSFQICAEDYATNNKCTEFSIDFEIPYVPLTVDWDVTVDAGTANFSAVHDSNRQVDSYIWDFGDGNTGSGKQVTHTYGDSGTYVVKLTAIPSDLPTGVTAPTAVGEVNISIPSNNDDSNDNNSGGGGGGGGSGDGIVFLDDGFVDGEVAGDSLNTSTSEQFYFAVDGPVTAYVNEPVTISLVVDSELGIEELQWEYGDGKFDVTDQIQVNHTYSATGTYQLIVSGRDKEGNMQTASIEVLVKDRARDEIEVVKSGSSDDSVGLSEIQRFIAGYPLLCCLFIIIFLLPILYWLYLRRKQRTDEQLKRVAPKNTYKIGSYQARHITGLTLQPKHNGGKMR